MRLANQCVQKINKKAPLNIKLIMFDLDGTLIHSAPELTAAANAMLNVFSKPPLAVEQVQHYIGEGAATLIKRCLNSDLSHASQPVTNQDNQVDAALLQKAHELFFDHYEKIVANSKPYEGVIEVLQDLYDKDYKLACVTNKPAQFTKPILAASGLEDFFEIVMSGDTLPRKKPDPMQLQYIAKHSKVPMTNALMVGDSVTDVAAANAAGCQVVVVSYGYNQGNPFNPSEIHACIEHISQLSDLLL